MLGIIISNYLFLKSSAILAVLLWLFANILPTHSNCGVFGFQTVKQRTLNIPGYFRHKPEILHKSILMLFPLYPRQWNRKKVFWMKRKAPLVDSKNFPVCFFPKEASFVLRSLKQTSRSRSSAWLRSVFPRKMSTGWNSSKSAGNRVEGPKRRL